MECSGREVPEETWSGIKLIVYSELVAGGLFAVHLPPVFYVMINVKPDTSSLFAHWSEVRPDRWL